MTNLVILTFQLFTTNIFPVGAKTDYGGWGAGVCWNAQIRYAVPTNLQPSVWLAEFTDTLQTSVSTWTNSDGTVETLYTGMPWTELNTGTNAVFTNSPNLDLGRFTNGWTGEWQTNIVRFPIPPEPTLFFRLKRVL